MERKYMNGSENYCKSVIMMNRYNELKHKNDKTKQEKNEQRQLFVTLFSHYGREGF